MTEVAVALIWEGGKFMICQRPARMFSGLSIVGFQFSPPRGGRLHIRTKAKHSLALTSMAAFR